MATLTLKDFEKEMLRPATWREVEVAHARWIRQILWCKELLRMGVEERRDLQDAFQEALREIEVRKNAYEALLERFVGPPV